MMCGKWVLLFPRLLVGRLSCSSLPPLPLPTLFEPQLDSTQRTEKSKPNPITDTYIGTHTYIHTIRTQTRRVETSARKMELEDGALDCNSRKIHDSLESEQDRSICTKARCCAKGTNCIAAAAIFSFTHSSFRCFSLHPP